MDPFSAVYVDDNFDDEFDDDFGDEFDDSDDDFDGDDDDVDGDTRCASCCDRAAFSLSWASDSRVNRPSCFLRNCSSGA